MGQYINTYKDIPYNDISYIDITNNGITNNGITNNDITYNIKNGMLHLSFIYCYKQSNL